MPDPGSQDREAVPASVDERRIRPHEGRPFLLGTIHPATEEILELAGTLGMRLVAEVYQGRDRPHPGTFFGKGKLDELKEAVVALRAGSRPEGWSWDGRQYRPTGEVPEEGTAWGGTRWARHHGGRTGGGEASETDDGTGDPLASHGGDDGGRRHAGGDAPVGQEGRVRGPPDLSAGKGESLLLILNDDVRPAVLFNLEERLGVEVWDRTRLILEIFGQHAAVKEAKLQVELAMLQYEIPLIHEAVHRRRTGERPGFMGGGEYEVADYEDFIKRRMRSVKDELERIRRERGVRRKVRRERFYLTSLAGYTNAGKSSLLNALTGAAVHQKQEMFSTLETTTRRMVEGAVLERLQEVREEPPMEEEPSDKPRPTRDERADLEAEEFEEPPSEPMNAYTRPILLTDTVGFIQALPSWLLDAFRSTLEEISVSDVVLLVVDAADPVEVLLEKVQVCREELSYLDVTCPVLLVLNKIDLVPEEVVEAKRMRLVQAGLARQDHFIPVSSVTGENLDKLAEAIQTALPSMIPYEAEVPTDAAGQRYLSLLYSWGEVHSVDYGGTTEVRGLADPLHWKTLVHEGLVSGADVSRRSR